MHTFTNAETGGGNCIPMCFSVLAYVEEKYQVSNDVRIHRKIFENGKNKNCAN
jgi:hypothetical protein